MAEKTKNEEMAAGVGQEKATHEPIDVYDSSHGKYDPPKVPTGNLKQGKGTVNPFGGLK